MTEMERPKEGAGREHGHSHAEQRQGSFWEYSPSGCGSTGNRREPPELRGSNHPRASARPFADAQPTQGARTVVHKKPWREVGLVNAPWLLSHSVEHESWLERRFIHVALACPVVSDIFHQPETIELTLPDETRRVYTPDFRVDLVDGSIVICETKPAKFVAQHQAVHQAAEAVIRKRGQSFAVITDQQIDHNSRSARAILLMRYGRLVFTPEEAQECKRLLQEEMNGSAHVQALIDRGVSEALIWQMVASHALRTQTPLNLTPLEPVEVNHPQENCLDHFFRWFSTSDR